MSDGPKPEQLRHVVFGGELDKMSNSEFRDPDRLDIAGMFANYAGAGAAWQAEVQGPVGSAAMRCVIVRLPRLLDPECRAPQRQ